MKKIKIPCIDGNVVVEGEAFDYTAGRQFFCGSTEGVARTLLTSAKMAMFLTDPLCWDALSDSLKRRIDQVRDDVISFTDLSVDEIGEAFDKGYFKLRKLSPREYFRLMGVKDEDIDIILDAVHSESDRYQLAGNSIVCQVLVGIFRRLLQNTDYDFYDMLYM